MKKSLLLFLSLLLIVGFTSTGFQAPNAPNSVQSAQVADYQSELLFMHVMRVDTPPAMRGSNDNATNTPPPPSITCVTDPFIASLILLEASIILSEDYFLLVLAWKANNCMILNLGNDIYAVNWGGGQVLIDLNDIDG